MWTTEHPYPLFKVVLDNRPRAEIKCQLLENFPGRQRKTKHFRYPSAFLYGGVMWASSSPSSWWLCLVLLEWVHLSFWEPTVCMAFQCHGGGIVMVTWNQPLWDDLEGGVKTTMSSWLITFINTWLTKNHIWALLWNNLFKKKMPTKT